MTITTRLQVSAVDWAVLALLVFEIPSLWFSQYCANSVPTTEVIALSIVAYFVLRFLVRAPRRALWMSVPIGLSCAWLAIAGIFQFRVESGKLIAVGLTDMVAFRSRLINSFAEWVPGEYFTFFLLSLPFACALSTFLWQSDPLKKKRKQFGLAIFALLPVAPIIAVLFLSLSRAIFWSTLLFFVVACALMTIYRVVTLRAASMLLAGIFVALLLVMLCETTLYPSIFEAYTGRHTSQIRSTQGRINIWSRSLEQTQAHRLWGVGSSNAALSLLSTADQDETTGFASRAFSLPIQVLVEKGISGFVLYGLFLLLAGWEFHSGMRLYTGTKSVNSISAIKKRKNTDRGNHEKSFELRNGNAHRAMKCCFAAGIIAVLFRELTYSSLLEHTLLLAMFFALVALACTGTKPHTLEIQPVACVVFVVVLALQIPFYNFIRANNKLSDFYSQVTAANFVAARESIDEAIRLWPWNSRYYGWRAYVGSQKLPSQCTKHSENNSRSLIDAETKQALAAVADYRKSLELNSRDAVAHHNLAWLEHLLGDDRSAAQNWHRSVEIDPGNAVFHLSYGMFLEENGDIHEADRQYETAIGLQPSILDSPFFTRYQNRSAQRADSVVRESIAQIESSLGHGDDPILEARLGKLYLQKGNIKRAEELLNKAVQQLPNLPMVWFNLGEVDEARGDSELSTRSYQKSLMMDGSLAQAYLRLGEVDLRAGRRDSAIRNLNLAIIRWQRITPVTSAHNNRLYRGPRQAIDDLLPTTQVWFVSPCESSQAWRGLAELFPKNRKYAQSTHACEEIPSPHSGLD